MHRLTTQDRFASLIDMVPFVVMSCWIAILIASMFVWTAGVCTASKASPLPLFGTMQTRPNPRRMRVAKPGPKEVKTASLSPSR